MPLFTAAGELSAAWADLGADSFFHPTGLFAQRFAADGSPLGPQLTLAEYTLRVDWPDQHLSRSYHNPARHMESHGDTQAFP
ncbi:MAG TPA: hypothetical protein VH988_15105 [Thermoanaerobaculia bacterium]|nr:hypothetical protein [Thermoanaerobaculia bacterium]